MNTLFCPKCGSVLHVSKTKMKCSCGYERTIHSTHKDYNLSETPRQKEIRVLDESENRMAVFDHTCKKCGHDKAELIEKGVSYSDEDDVVLFKCGKCGNTEMQEAKVT